MTNTSGYDAIVASVSALTEPLQSISEGAELIKSLILKGWVKRGFGNDWRCRTNAMYFHT